jgi:DNA repair protein RadC
MTRANDSHQVSLLAPDVAEILYLVRENLRLLAELASRYEVARLAPVDPERVVRNPGDVMDYLGPEMTELAQEQMRVILLTTRHQVLGTQLIYQGGVNATVIRLADCFRDAVARGAAAVILVHNHPSGEASPSAEDVRFTHVAAEAGELLGIPVLDHVVLARGGFTSLRQHQLYTPPVPPGSPPVAPAGGCNQLPRP